MLTGKWVDALVAISDDDDLTVEVDLGYVFDSVLVYIPTLTASDLTLYAAETKGGTYYAVGNSVTVAAGTGSFYDWWNLGGFQYIKIGTSAGQAADRTFRVAGVRS
jgi:hypothetical protein